MAYASGAARPDQRIDPAGSVAQCTFRDECGEKTSGGAGRGRLSSFDDVGGPRSPGNTAVKYFRG
jgi:hypothetical protein